MKGKLLPVLEIFPIIATVPPTLSRFPHLNDVIYFFCLVSNCQKKYATHFSLTCAHTFVTMHTRANHYDFAIWPVLTCAHNRLSCANSGPVLCTRQPFPRILIVSLRAQVLCAHLLSFSQLNFFVRAACCEGQFSKN